MFKRILAVVMLSILLVGGLVPAASAVTWKEPWDFSGGYYTEDWAKHFATKKVTTNTKTTMYRVRKHAYNTESKKFETVSSLRVRWEPRAYVLNSQGKQIKRWFTRENRLTYTTAHYSYLYYKAGDELAIEVTEQFGEILGKGLANIADVINPELFVIGGGVSKAGQVVIDLVKKNYVKYVFHGSRGTQFALATLGNDAGIYGSAKLVLDGVKDS